MIPIKQFKVDFTSSDNKQKEKDKPKVKGDVKKRSRPITGKVAAIVDDSKAKLQKMMKLNKSSIKDQVEVPNIDKVKTTKEIKISKQQQQAQTSKVTKFDTETFLKSQKQKQKQYAKQLNKQFQQSKKQRMNKLYQRQKQANEKIAQTKVQIKNKHKFYDQLPILMRYPVETSNQFILQTHHVTKIKQFISFIDVKQLRLNQQQSSNSKWQKTEKLCDDITKLKFVQFKNQQIKIKNQIIPYPQHDNLLNIIVMIAMKPQLLQKITLHDQKMVTQKVYPFLMYKNNKRFTVIVDNYLQIEQLEFGQVHKFSHCKNKNITWVSLFEKAYLRLFKKVGTLHEVTNNILNIMPEVIKISQNAIIKQNLFDVLRFHLRNGGLLGAMRKGQLKGSSAYEGRVYPIKQVRVGRVLQQSSLLVINPWHGKSLLSDGRQHISFKDLITQFNRLILIKNYPSTYIGSQLNINMYSFGIPASNNPEWVKNHQYLININKTSAFRIILKRTDQYSQIFGFSLVRCEPQDTKIVAINLDRLVVTTRSTLVNEASFADVLEKGSYMILPFTHKRSQNSYVFLKLQIFTSNQGNFSWGKSKIVDVQYKQIGKIQDKVQGDLQVIQKFQKPRSKLILQKGDKHLISDLLEIKDIPNLFSQNSSYKHDDIMIPGFAHRFITKQNIVIEQKPATQKQKTINTPENPEISFMTQNQQLKILLGIDAYTDDVDKQMMQEAFSHLEQQIDLSNYQLGDQGFEKVIEFMMQQPRIRVINLKNNLLNDKSIVLLCYYLQKSNHNQIRKLDLSNNLIKGIGVNALQGLVKRIKNIKQIILTGNAGVKVQQIKNLLKL